jgi:hypothetical protein
MNKIKNIFIATLLLNTSTVFNQEFIQQSPTSTDDIINETISPETTQEATENLTTEEQEAIKKWNAHLEALKEKDNDWNKNSNIPTNDWKDEAILLAKEALNQDKTITQTLKSAFFNAITDKIKLEEGEFTASTYAVIKEFDDAIDAHAATLTKPEEKPEINIEEETQPESIVEPVTAPIEIEVTPELPTQEASASQPEITTPPVTESTNNLQEWNDQLIKITTMGNSESENKNLIIKTYELAKKLLLEGYTGESLLDGFKYAIVQHNTNQNLFPIKINQAIEAFGAETGIIIPGDQKTQATQEEYNAAMKKQAELKTAATVQEAIKRAHVSESDMQRLNKKLEQRLALEAAARAAQQKETDAKIASLKQDLASAHKVKVKETPEEQGIIKKAVKAVKDVASAATTWWYGGESQEEKDIAILDQERLHKLQEILKTMPLTAHEKLTIENSWKTFIEQLRSFKNVDTHDTQATEQWLTKIKQALERLTLTHNIISIADAISIIKDAINQHPDEATFINDIKAYLTEKQQKIIITKQQKENAQAKKIQVREQRKELVQRKQQKIKDENERIRAEQNIIESYEREKTEWQQFLTQIANNKQATEQENNAYTNEAIKKAGLLLNPAQSIILKDKHRLEQDLKEQFTLALLAQQGNEHKINIHKNMDQFNVAIDTMTR